MSLLQFHESVGVVRAFLFFTAYVVICSAHVGVSIDPTIVCCGHVIVSGHVAVNCGHVVVSCDHVVVSCDHVVVCCDQVVIMRK